MRSRYEFIRLLDDNGPLGNLGHSDIDELTPESTFYRRLLEETGFSENSIRSFNHTVEVLIPNQIRNRILVSPNLLVRFDNVQFLKPKADDGRGSELHPLTCHRRKLTYRGDILMDAYLYAALPGGVGYSTTPYQTSPNIPIGAFPYMLGSSKCHLHGKSMQEKAKMGIDPSDPLGYFIVKGTEKAVANQEKLRENIPIAFLQTGDKGQMQVRWTISTIYGSSVVIASVGEAWSTYRINLSHLGSRVCLPLYLVYFFLGVDMNTATAMILKYLPSDRPDLKYALEPSKAKTIGLAGREVDYMFNRRGLGDVKDRKNAHLRITMDIWKDLFANLSVLGITPDQPEYWQIGYRKLEHLSLMISILIRTQKGIRPPDDRDKWGNKRIELPGREINILFTQALNKIMTCAQNTLTNKGPSFTINTAIPNLTNDFESAFSSSGSWGIKGTNTLKENIVEALKRDTPLSVFSQIGRINAPTSRQAKQLSIRGLQLDQTGFVCPVETPEGETIGLVKNVAETMLCSLDRGTEDLEACLKMAEAPRPSETRTAEHTHLFLPNGIISGWYNGPQLRDFLIQCRRMGQLPFDCCIYLNPVDGFIEYSSIGSRPCRPLLIIRNGQLVADLLEVRITPEEVEIRKKQRLEYKEIKTVWDLTPDELRRRGAMEYVDVREQEDLILAPSPQEARRHYRELKEKKTRLEALRTALASAGAIPSTIDKNFEEKYREYPDYLRGIRDYLESKAEVELLEEIKYTHAEINPSAIFGISGSLIPRANQSQGPRISYQAGMGKQALNAYNLFHHLRYDTSYKRLLGAQRSFFETLIAKLAGLTILPNTTNPIVCFMALPKNNEDGIVIKRQYLERNMRIEKYTTHTVIAKKTGVIIETFERPSLKHADREGIYAAIDERGLPRIGAEIRQGQCIVGRTRYSQATKAKADASFFAGVGEEGYVDRVLFTRDAGNNEMVRVKIRKIRNQIKGDKLAARAAQKGVGCEIRDEIEMPYVVGGINDGLRPDLIINPHSIPSRMTMVMLEEIRSSRWALYTGKIIDATTTFEPANIQKIKDDLIAMGMDPDGEERMAHPDGELIETPVMIGPCAYQSLKHHVLDKYYSRGQGSIKPLTHQPIGGRAREGALRVGEMERDAMIGAGATALLRERLMDVSDRYQTVICAKCGYIAIFNVNKSQGGPRGECKICKTSSFGPIVFPYVLKLVIQLIAGVEISVTLKTRQKVPDGALPEEFHLD